MSEGLPTHQAQGQRTSSPGLTKLLPLGGPGGPKCELFQLSKREAQSQVGGG